MQRAWYGLTAVPQASATGENWNVPDRFTGDLNDPDGGCASSTVPVALANGGLRHNGGAGAQAMRAGSAKPKGCRNGTWATSVLPEAAVGPSAASQQSNAEPG